MGITRRAVGWIVTGLFTLGVVPVVQQFVSKVTEEWGWYDQPAQKVGTMTAFFASLTGTAWFYPALAFIGGAVAFYWLSEFLPKSEKWNHHARLTLVFGSEANQAWASRQENVLHYIYKPLLKQKIVHGKVEEITPIATMVFLSLKAPTHTNYSRIQVIGGGIECMLEHAGPAGALIQIEGDVRGRTLDVRFSDKPIPLE
jgi:hypothetical protein